IAPSAPECPLQDNDAGEAELPPEPNDRRRDHAEVLGDQRQHTQLIPDGLEELTPRPAPPHAPTGRPPPLRHGPAGDEAAEAVDPSDVDELERPPEAFDPPAVARRPHRA